MFKKVILLAGAMLFISGCSYRPSSGDDTSFTIMWSIYAGWMPWPYAAEHGIVDKWADKYGIDIEFKQADYVPSIEAYVAGEADGVVMTNMEALNFAGTAGVDSTAVITGDFSNGNDALLTRNGLGICDLKGTDVYLAEFSVSHYLLARGFEEECGGKLSERDVNIINASDSDIGPVFLTDKDQKAIVTWNPIVLEVLSQDSKVKNAYASDKIPYEILDPLFLRTDVLEKHPELAKALAGAWYETMELMYGGTAEGEAALKQMAERAGTSADLYKQQLETTEMWWKPEDGVAFLQSRNLKDVMEKVAEFSFEHGLYGPRAASAGQIGIEYPDKTVLGNKDNIQIRFTDVFMRLAAEGSL